MSMIRQQKARRMKLRVRFITLACFASAPVFAGDALVRRLVTKTRCTVSR